MKIATRIMAVCSVALLLQHCKEPVYNIPQKDIGNLKKNLDSIITNTNATVGLYFFEIESGDGMGINHRVHFPMQSVYKIPLAMLVLKKVEQGELELQKVDNLIMQSIKHSDNPASETLFQMVGGTATVNDFIQKKGYADIHIGYTGEEPDTGYKYSCTPYEISRLLGGFFNGKLLNEEHTRLLLDYMIQSKSDTRLKGMLPPETVVAHKIGTGDGAYHDVGIIYMPNGKHLVVSVFMMDAKGTMQEAERVISELTGEIYEYYVNG